jgi:hypothetical protein
MAALGVPCVARDERRIGYGARNRPGDDGHTYLSVCAGTGPTVVADNRHWCFRVPTRAAVDAFHAAGLASGGRCDGPPASAPTTTRSITPPSSLTQTATASRPSVTGLSPGAESSS